MEKHRPLDEQTLTDSKKLEPHELEEKLEEVDIMDESTVFNRDSSEQTNENITPSEETVEKDNHPQNSYLKLIHQQLKLLEQNQQEMTKEFQAKLKYDKHKDQLIDKLHKELQAYKDDVIKAAMTPIVKDLIMLNDNIYKLVENYRNSSDPLDGEEILNHLFAVTNDINDVLYRQGIETFSSPDEKVDLMKQTIFKTIKTADQSKEKHLAERLRKGYVWDEQMIRKELVSVYVYDEMAKQDEEKGADNDE